MILIGILGFFVFLSKTNPRKIRSSVSCELFIYKLYIIWNKMTIEREKIQIQMVKWKVKERIFKKIL